MTEKNLRVVGNYLMVSLAVADLLVASLVMPVLAVKEIIGRWVMGAIICNAWITLDVLLCTCSILHLLAIAVDRYWAVTKARYIFERPVRPIITMIFLSWFVSILLCATASYTWWMDYLDELKTNERVMEEIQKNNLNPEKFLSKTATNTSLCSIDCNTSHPLSNLPSLGFEPPTLASTSVMYDPDVTGECKMSQDLDFTVYSTVAAFYLPLILIIIIYAKIYGVARRRIRKKNFKSAVKMETSCPESKSSQRNKSASVSLSDNKGDEHRIDIKLLNNRNNRINKNTNNKFSKNKKNNNYKDNKSDNKDGNDDKMKCETDDNVKHSNNNHNNNNINNKNNNNNIIKDNNNNDNKNNKKNNNNETAAKDNIDTSATDDKNNIRSSDCRQITIARENLNLALNADRFNHDAIAEGGKRLKHDKYIKQTIEKKTGQNGNGNEVGGVCDGDSHGESANNIESASKNNNEHEIETGNDEKTGKRLIGSTLSQFTLHLTSSTTTTTDLAPSPRTSHSPPTIQSFDDDFKKTETDGKIKKPNGDKCSEMFIGNEGGDGKDEWDEEEEEDDESSAMLQSYDDDVFKYNDGGVDGDGGESGGRDVVNGDVSVVDNGGDGDDSSDIKDDKTKAKDEKKIQMKLESQNATKTPSSFSQSQNAKMAPKEFFKNSTVNKIRNFSISFESNRASNENKMAKKTREKKEQSKERKAARTLAIITGTFIICWLPFFIIALVMPFCSSSCHVPPLLESSIAWLGYLNSGLNPIIYTVFNVDFRRAFQKILSRSRRLLL